MEQSSVNQRLNLLVSTFEKGKKAAFARKVDISPQGAQELLAGRKGDPSFKVLIKILEAYPQIRTDWVLFGRGDMLRAEEKAGPSVVLTESEAIKNRAFLPPLYEIGKPVEEEWAKYRKNLEQQDKDRQALWSLVEYMAKNDPSGEVGKIMQLLPAALLSNVDPDTLNREMDAILEEEQDKDHAEQQAEWERKRSEDAKKSKNRPGQR